MLKVDFLKQLESKGILMDNYDLTSVPEEFISKSKITYKCLVHDLEINRYVGNIRTSLCKQCSLDARSRTLQELLDALGSDYADYTFFFKEDQLNKPFKILEKFKICCPKGHEYNTHFSTLLTRKTKCGVCEGNVRETIQTLVAKVDKKFPNSFKYVSGEYVNQRSPLIFNCNTCKEDFETTGNRLLSMAHNCCGSCSHKLAGKERRKSPEKFIEEVSLLHNHFYDYSSTNYISASRDIDVICPLHGIFTLRAGDHLHNKQGCPKCSRLSSDKQKHLYFWLKQTFPDLKIEEEVVPKWLKLYGSIRSSELDIFIPSLNLGIEYNGTYWHSEKSLLSRGRENYHHQKYLKCKENGVDLIHIFEFENLDKWKRKLANYIANPSQYTVQFSNEKRTVDSFVLKGKTLIKLA